MVSGLVAATLGKKPGVVKPDDILFSGRTGFDSFSLMELVLRLEATFDLSIPDEDLDLAIFQSVRSISSYIKARLGREL